MKKAYTGFLSFLLFLTAAGLVAALIFLLCEYVPRASVRHGLLAVCGGIMLISVLWVCFQRWQITRFADEVCETIDAAMADHPPENFHPYEDSLTSKVQSKLMQYYDRMREGQLQSKQDKETLQSLVSDISHQVKTPIANIRLYTGILHKPNLTKEEREMFLATLENQVDKLDFLMQSLIKMSRLETGTFVLHPADLRVSDTIAQAMSAVWIKAERKNIRLTVECCPEIMVWHDSKWTAEAFGNLLDNAVKYTKEGGSVAITVRPWQFYTRIDITDTGIGISKEHYNDVFQRFYRAQEAASEEGVGLGLYLANGIITRQKGYISVKSRVGEGTTFSVYLLSSYNEQTGSRKWIF